MLANVLKLHFFMAHAFGVRYELPIPLWLFVLGGAGIVLVSAAFVLPRPVIGEEHTYPDETYPSPLKLPQFSLSLLLLAGLIYAGLAGSQKVSENILPTLFWLVLWIAIPLSCGIIGDWVKSWNVFAGIARLLDSPNLRRSLLGHGGPLAWPTRLGWWPAAALYFLLACGELIFNSTATIPHVIASGLASYLIISGLMGLAFGEAWLQRGEIFSVLFSTWGRLGWFRFGAPGKRGFAGGLGSRFDPSPSRITFILLLLASVSFDGLMSTPLWNNYVVSLSTSGLSDFQVRTQFLAAFLLVIALFWLFFGAFSLAVNIAGRLGKRPLLAIATLLPSLIPISFAYLFAHNFQYLAINSQLLFPLIGNPVGLDSWPLSLPYPFNDSFEPNIHILPGAMYWYIAVALIVAAHIAALFISHRDIGTVAKSEQQARRAEYPWVGAMVLYTMLSLWLLAQPLVKEKGGQSGFAVPSDPQTQIIAS